MSLLLVAIVLTLWLAKVARSEPGKPTRLHIAVALICMLVWTGIIVAGRYIAYYIT
jgi:hypothetical protein